MLYAHDCPESWDKYEPFNKIAKEFSNVTSLSFGHMDLTSAYFEGTWPYWTPLFRFYKMSNLKYFDYYYEDLKVKVFENHLKQNSNAYKWFMATDQYKYRVS